MMHVYAVSKPAEFQDMFKPQFEYVVTHLDPEEFEAWLKADSANDACTITHLRLDLEPDDEEAADAILSVNELAARSSGRILEKMLEAVGLFGQQNPHH